MANTVNVKPQSAESSPEAIAKFAESARSREDVKVRRAELKLTGKTSAIPTGSKLKHQAATAVIY